MEYPGFHQRNQSLSPIRSIDPFFSLLTLHFPFLPFPRSGAGRYNGWGFEGIISENFWNVICDFGGFWCILVTYWYLRLRFLLSRTFFPSAEGDSNRLPTARVICAVLTLSVMSATRRNHQRTLTLVLSRCADSISCPGCDSPSGNG